MYSVAAAAIVAGAVALATVRDAIPAIGPAELVQARIAERVAAGLARAKRQGKTLGRPRAIISRFQLARVAGLSSREAAKVLGVPRSTFQRYLAQKPR